MADALRLAMDYFSMGQDAFLRRWLPDRDRETSRQTTPESWQYYSREPQQPDTAANRSGLGANRPTCLCSQVPVQARPKCLCIV